MLFFCLVTYAMTAFLVNKTVRWRIFAQNMSVRVLLCLLWFGESVLPISSRIALQCNKNKARRIKTVYISYMAHLTGLILGLHLANEIRRYKVTPSLIGWAQT